MNYSLIKELPNDDTVKELSSVELDALRKLWIEKKVSLKILVNINNS